MRFRPALLLASTLSLGWGWSQQEPARTPAEAVADAARALLESMTPEQKARAHYPYDAAERADWHFTPRDRPGVALLELDAQQRIAVGVLLRAAFGGEGHARVEAVRQLDAELRRLAQNRGERAEHRDPLLYELAVFGQPSASDPWAFRFEGHHVSVHFAADGAGQFAFSPFSLGANPHRIPDSERAGERVLGAYEEAARALFVGLNADQRAAARVATEAAPELLLAPGVPLRRLEPAGIAGRDLDPEQRRALLWLVAQFLGDLHPELGGLELLQQARAQIEELRFAWLGSAEFGATHGFRVQSPRWVFEWTTAQGDPNHVHSAWRDLERDASLAWGLPQAVAR